MKVPRDRTEIYDDDACVEVNVSDNQGLKAYQTTYLKIKNPDFDFFFCEWI